MQIIKTQIPEVLILETRRHGDRRGFLVEIFRNNLYFGPGLQTSFVQENWSRSHPKVLRGLHLQKNPNSQSKLVTVLRGVILDVAVDVRIGSPTFGRHVAVEISEENGRQVYIPRGFAHGFVVLSGPADVIYKCDNLYSPNDEISIYWNDATLEIDWRISDPIVSDRDAGAPLLANVQDLPVFEG